ncbi:898_t:CDS:2 [Funneliformis caledonium]|uniref:898_t:CDS:1 n=2 Tax=Funneliformis TaxID=1117308 RepID=A0A9N9A124_9GLOM|nr:898_t:CDS:2 [Funneliformis caledonium]CAG8532429.1 332_t:CDS:2 [Funneliformis mosseae]
MVKELPRELWLEVFKHFIVNFGFAELFKYREVCKVWYELIIVIVLEKLTYMLTRIKFYYRILKGPSDAEIEEILANASSSSENTNDTITYNYQLESFEYHFITALKAKQDKEEIFKQQECYRICIIFHLAYKFFNFNLIKKFRERFIVNNWFNIEEDVIDNDSRFIQRIMIKGNKLLPCIDQIHDLIDGLSNIPSQ